MDTKWRVVKCKYCGLKSLDPIPSDDELANIYSSYAECGNRIQVEKDRIDIYTEKLQKLEELAPGLRLFDIGAGLGTFVATARQNGFDAYGIEYTKEQCILAKEIWDVELKHGLFEDVYKNFAGKFDVVHLHHVLEHVRSPRRVLSCIKEVLSKDGILLLEVPNQFGSFSREIQALFGRYVKPRSTLHHLYFFTPETLRSLLTETGFRIEKLNQFRPRKRKLTGLQRIPRDIYRQLIKLIGCGGEIIEVYARNTG